MKMIIAVVRPFLIDKIVAALEDTENFPGITITDAEGFGQRLRNSYSSQLDPFQPKKEIKIAAPDEMVEHLVEVIGKCAHTGKKGDGIIWVLPIENSVLI